MKQMYGDLKDKGFEVVGVTTYYGFFANEKNLTPDQEFARLPEHIKEFGLPWPIVVADRANFENYGVGGIPHYVVVGRDGRVAGYTIAYNDDLFKQLRAKVEKALDAKVAVTR